MKHLLNALAALLLVTTLLPEGAQAGQRFNVIGRTQVMDQGRGEVRVDGGGQDVSQLQVDVHNGPVTMTKVLVHFADPKIKPFAKAIRPRKDAAWTSDPIKWPSGKVHKVTRVEFFFTGTTGMKAEVALLGLQ
jgi:hypothetical protein